MLNKIAVAVISAVPPERPVATVWKTSPKVVVPADVGLRLTAGLLELNSTRRTLSESLMFMVKPTVSLISKLLLPGVKVQDDSQGRVVDWEHEPAATFMTLN